MRAQMTLHIVFATESALAMGAFERLVIAMGTQVGTKVVPPVTRKRHVAPRERAHIIWQWRVPRAAASPTAAAAARAVLASVPVRTTPIGCFALPAPSVGQ